jgi:ABC-type amino acid transport substrate-binding protein
MTPLENFKKALSDMIKSGEYERILKEGLNKNQPIIINILKHS